MTTCAYCGSQKTPTYCFGDGEPICHECHTALPDTIAGCRHEIVRLQESLMDATAHLAAATSAYGAYVGRFDRPGRKDALFYTRIADFQKAEKRARAVVRKFYRGK